MQAALLTRYSKEFKVSLREIPIPEPCEQEILIRVKAAAVNPLDNLIGTGQVRLIQPFPMPVILGNECSGVVERVGRAVKGFKPGDCVYTRLPLKKIGAFAEYVAVDSSAVAQMPSGYDFIPAAAIPLTGLTAYQGLVEELEVKPGRTLLITGGSGSFGQIAVPIARAMGLRVIVTGNARSQEKFIKLGVERYIDYRQENYWESLSEIDYVIDTLGATDFGRELSVLRKGGRLLSLRTGPNRLFAQRNHFSWWKRELFAIAGRKYDSAAEKQGKAYRFMFVRSDGAQLKKVTEIVEQNHIVPDIDPRIFSLSQVNEALALVAKGGIDGKVIVQI